MEEFIDAEVEDRPLVAARHAVEIGIVAVSTQDNSRRMEIQLLRAAVDIRPEPEGKRSIAAEAEMEAFPRSEL